MTSSPNERQYSLSRESIDAGADLVIGHHPHVIQKIENYKGKLIFYSLGNCIFDAVTPAARKSMVVEFKLNNGDAEIILHPIYLSHSQTFLMDHSNGEEFLNNLQSISSTSITIKNGKGQIFLKDYL
ncbi:MAG: CapA family protein [Euryarchaeota archaeon]|nr:CapA family protein [Euryarchaeota archaeon]MBU4607538.1 CapA family protein [Euryarchaeota archaeon]MBV1729347.1 CapA family protein [Methanobacterium sp.]MBV1754006.1 CapA family protein [Methanobacterium sp.]MBV1766935.1 CapA family protein [Methanobacterium sp.]